MTFKYNSGIANGCSVDRCVNAGSVQGQMQASVCVWTLYNNAGAVPMLIDWNESNE